MGILDLEESLNSKETAKCLAWCNSNKSKLQKIKSRLEWELRLQDFIELIKNEKRNQAVQYSRKFLAQLSPSEDEIGQVMALLGSFHNYCKIIFLVVDCPRFFEIQKAFPASTHINRYKGLFSEERWLFLSHMCRFDILRLHSLGEISVFERTLEAGLAAMKTHQCFDEKTTKDACPVCSDKLNSIAHRLPFAHCTQSRLICSYTGDEMN